MQKLKVTEQNCDDCGTGRQPNHIEINDAINLLTIACDELEDLLVKIQHDQIAPVDEQENAMRCGKGVSPSLVEVLQGSASRINDQTSRLQDYKQRLNELLF